MAIPEADRWLPPRDTGLGHVFDAVNETLIDLDAPRSTEAVFGLAIGAYFHAGLGHLANRGHDAYMQEIGTVTWELLRSGKAQLLATPLPTIGVILASAATADLFFENWTPDRSLAILFGRGFSGVEKSKIIVGPEFAVRAKDRPIEVLAQIAWVASHIRDLSVGRAYSDPENIPVRAAATEAHLFIEACRTGIGHQLTERAFEVIQQYPEGINSLPDGVL